MANAKISELPVLQKLGNTGAAPDAARNWDFAYTWTVGGTTYTADYMNVTDTASAAASLLIDRQVGSVTKFSVGKDGAFGVKADSTLKSTILIGQNGMGWYRTTESSPRVAYGTNGFIAGSTEQYFWTNTSANATATPDTGLARNSAGVVEANNGSKGSVRYLMGGGTAVASAAALPLPTGSVFHVTGTTGITSITSTSFQSGVMITLIFDGALTVTDGGNLKLAGNFTTTADDTLTLIYDGINWYECCRSVN